MAKTKEITYESAVKVIAAMFVNAREEKDYAWFYGNLARYYMDSVGVDRNVVLGHIDQLIARREDALIQVSVR